MMTEIQERIAKLSAQPSQYLLAYIAALLEEMLKSNTDGMSKIIGAVENGVSINSDLPIHVEVVGSDTLNVTVENTVDVNIANEPISVYT